jgi:hypothetical protein
MRLASPTLTDPLFVERAGVGNVFGVARIIEVTSRFSVT